MQAVAVRKTEKTMRGRLAKTGSDKHPKCCNALKDEVYRQMFRVEEGRTGADKELALVLLRGWITLDVQPRCNEVRNWLRSICPICVELIESSSQSGSAGKGRRSCP